MCPKNNTPNKKHEIPSAKVTAAKSKKLTQLSSIKIFSSPSESDLTLKISDSSKSFKGQALLHYQC